MSSEIDSLREDEDDLHSCFICKHSINTSSSPSCEESTKVFVNSWAKFVHVIAPINWSVIKICPECLPPCGEFCSLYEKMVALRLQLEWTLGRILEQCGAEPSPEIAQDSSEFRELLLQKSAEKVATSAPALVMERMEVEADIKPDLNHLEPESPVESPWIPAEEIKSEPPEESSNDCDSNSDDSDWDPDSADEPPDDPASDPELPAVKSEPESSNPPLIPPFKTTEQLCPSCGKTFSKWRYLRIHLKNVHKNDVVKDYPYICTNCSKRFPLESRLIAHRQTCKPDGIFKCEKCGQICKTKKSMWSHMSIVHGERKFKCTKPGCAQRFGQKCELRRHVRVIHDTGKFDQKTLKCPKCEKWFKNKKGLDSHVKEVHGKERFKCGECGKGFKVERYMKVHYKKRHLNA